MSDNFYTHPRSITTVADGTLRSVEFKQDLPLFRPLFVLPLEMGEPGEVEWYENGTVFLNACGRRIIEKTKWNTPAVDMLIPALANNGAFVARALSDDAKDGLSLVSLRFRKEDDKLFISFFTENNIIDILTSLNADLDPEEIDKELYTYKKTRELFEELKNEQPLIAFDIKEEMDIPATTTEERWFEIVPDEVTQDNPDILMLVAPEEGIPSGNVIFI